MKNITVLGATGSIGTSTLAVAGLHPDKFNIFALSAYTNWQKMQDLCEKFQPHIVVMPDEIVAEKLSKTISNDIQILFGIDALNIIAAHNETDYVMAAIVGSAGMESSLSAAKAGKRVMLANKESLVMAGDLFMHIRRFFNVYKVENQD
jgi:1-deoxy-D-xylulose-5-phosphate reductoisomerase